jgi:hypothetical protein
MHMQRKWRSSVLVSLLFTLVLAGCSSGGGDSASTAPVVPAGTAEGLWTGTITDLLGGQRTISGVVLDDGSYWFLYSAAGTPTIMAGTLQGNVSTQNGTFASSDGRDFSNEFAEIFAVTVTAPYVMQQNLGGTLKYSGPIPLTFTSTFDSEYNVVPVITNVAGTYSGSAFGFPHTITVDPSGTITVTTSGGPHTTGLGPNVSGIELGCDFTGTLSPRPNGGNVYDIDLTPDPSNGATVAHCNPATLTGVAFFDAAIAGKKIYVLALNSSRNRVFPFTGTK